MITFLGSLTLGVAVAILLNWLSYGAFEEPFRKSIKRAAAIGALVMVVNILAIKLPAVLGVLMVLPIAAAMVYLVLWWDEEGSSVKEALIFILINVILAIVMNNAALRILDMTSIGAVRAIFRSLSTIAVLASTGAIIADAIWFRLALEDAKAKKEEEGGEEDEEDDEES